MHCDMLKIQDGGAIVEKVNSQRIRILMMSDISGFENRRLITR